MSFPFKIIDDDYHALTLQGLHTVEVQVVESIVGVMEEIEEPIVADIDCEVIFQDAPAAAIEVLTFTGAPAILELGAELISPALAATYNLAPTTAVLNDSEGNAQVDIIADPNNFIVPYTYSKTGNNEFVRWTVTAGIGANTDDQDQLTFWQPLVYWGTGSALGVGNGSEAFIEALAGSNLQPDGNSSFSVSPLVTEKIYFAAPTSFGALQFFIGSPLPGGMFLVGNNIPVTPNTPNGVPQNYSLWETVSVGLGPTSVTVIQV